MISRQYSSNVGFNPYSAGLKSNILPTATNAKLLRQTKSSGVNDENRLSCQYLAQTLIAGDDNRHYYGYISRLEAPRNICRPYDCRHLYSFRAEPIE